MSRQSSRVLTVGLVLLVVIAAVVWISRGPIVDWLMRMHGVPAGH